MARLFFVVFLLLNAIVSAEALVNDEEGTWDDAPYVVKIFARHPLQEGQKASRVKACSGSLVSPALVLTATECLTNGTTREDLEEVMVSYHKYGSRRQTRVAAHIVEKTELWTLLQVQPLDVSQLCPQNRTARIARLHVLPSLTKDRLIQLTFEQIQHLRCWINGFETTGTSQGFINEHDMVKMQLSGFERDVSQPQQMVYHVVDNSSACIDDIGAALVCRYEEGDLQVGLLKALLAYPSKMASAQSIEDPQMRNLAICAATVQMVFVEVFEDVKLLEAIERHDLANFVHAYSLCGFTPQF